VSRNYEVPSVPQVSVIVPARDVVQYIGLLLDDLRHQTFADVEIVVVDDGSRDGTAAVIDRFADEDGRFVPVRGDGRGPSAARNLGLERASGAYLAFVDADDRVARDYVQAMHDALEDGGELAICNARRLAGYETRASGLHLRAFQALKATTHLRETPQLVNDSTVWNKLVRREVWERDPLRFDDGRWINDIYPSLRSHVLSARTIMVDQTLYHWRVRRQPSTSITDSKLTSPTARLKSLEDRTFAVVRTRRMLASDLPEPEVLRAFDERVLTHDYWTYLPLYHEGDDRFRRQLVEDVGRYLEEFDVDAASFRLGVQLDSAYRAISAGDVDRFERAVTRDSHVRGSVRRNRLVTSVCSHRHSAIAKLRADWWPLFRREPEPTLTIDARMASIGLDPHGSDPLEVAGSVRFRDGRSDVEGPWSLELTLEGVRSGRTLSGPPAEVATADDAHLHPLRRTGWRAYTTAFEPSALVSWPDEQTWRVGLRAVLHGRRLPVRAAPNTRAVRALGTGRPVDEVTDLVLVPRKGGRLELRREPAPVRLRSAAFIDETQLEFEFERLGPGAPSHLWLAASGDEPPASTTPYADQIKLEVPIDRGDDRWELWCRTDGRIERVRAHRHLAEVRIPGPDRTETVVRPTVRGRVVVERREAQVQVDDLRLDGSTGDVLVRGPALPRHLPEGSMLSVGCHWTRESHRFPLVSGSDAWWSRIPLSTLFGREDLDLIPRHWSLRIAGRGQPATTVSVGSGSRERFPVVDQGPAGGVELRIASRSRASLWAWPPDSDR
jgi:glycosyltransferase involved in cell wall biosynthesis